MAMSWYEHWIRRYEHRRWTTDDNRMVRPFEWGLEHLTEVAPRLRSGQASGEWLVASGREQAEHGEARAYVREYAREATARSEEWYAAEEVRDYRLDGENVLTFTSTLESAWAENKTVQANRQAVKDARACLTWLEQRGYDRLGILGTSIGSSVGYIALVHDRRVRAWGFFHVSTYFADVVSQGMTTNHVWEGLRHEVSVEELREFWMPISPMPYVERGMGARRNTFMVYGKYDPTFLPEFTQEMLGALRRNGAETRTLELPVGHYSLELAPFSWVAGWRMFSYFLEALG